MAENKKKKTQMKRLKWKEARRMTARRQLQKLNGKAQASLNQTKGTERDGVAEAPDAAGNNRSNCNNNEKKKKDGIK